LNRNRVTRNYNVNGRTDGRPENMMLTPTIVRDGIKLNGDDRRNADKYVEYWLM